jgi:plasmid stability protein
MSNFIVAIPDELLTDAKVMAAKTGTSLNAIIRSLLDGFVQSESSPMAGNFELLLKYSLGQLTAKQTIKLLHLKDEAALHVLTLKAGFPLPRLSIQETEIMKKRFSEMLAKAST